MSTSLVLAIPTYNRPDILGENLERMLPQLLEHRIPVYISDDSTNSDTEYMVKGLKGKYPHIHYSLNRPGLGHDRNCLQTLRTPDSDYIWYLGDSQLILPDGLRKVLEIIRVEKPDLVAVNAVGRAPWSYRSGPLNDPDTILENLAWHLTLTGVTIYRNECLSRFLNSETAEKYPNFVQLGLLLEIAAKGNGMYWIDERLIDNHPKKKSYWSKNLFHVFLEDWSKTIGNIPPEYSKKSKEIALLSHSEYTGLLGQKDLEQRRIDGIFDFKTAFRYCGLWRKVTGVQWARIVLISVLPISMLEKLPKDRSSLSYWKELRRKYRPAWLDRAIKAMKRRRKKG